MTTIKMMRTTTTTKTRHNKNNNYDDNDKNKNKYNNNNTILETMMITLPGLLLQNLPVLPPLP